MFSIPRRSLAALTIAAGAALATSHADAGHRERAYERENVDFIAEKLQRMGFVSWRKLKLDGRAWEIEDAVRDNGKKYDMKLEVETLDLVKLEREDF